VGRPSVWLTRHVCGRPLLPRTGIRGHPWVLDVDLGGAHTQTRDLGHVTHHTVTPSVHKVHVVRVGLRSHPVLGGHHGDQYGLGAWGNLGLVLTPNVVEPAPPLY